MKLLRIISRLFVGIVFVFSGFVKAIDPLGSAYKFSDYFHAFGLGFFEPLALSLSIILASAEITMGIALLLNYRMRFFSWLVMIFMTFFTILTFILALYNPVSDCGCFGDAIILTNWQTFWKNIVLMLFVVIILVQRNKYQEIINPLNEWIVIGIVFTFFVAFSLYSYNHLPIVDFRPYSTGTNIPYKMITPPGAQSDKYETRLTYINKLTGSKEIFSLENLPADTSLYEFLDAESILISKGYEPPIHDFYISNKSGIDITDNLLNDPGFSFLLISHNLSKANKKALVKAEKYEKFAKVTENVRFYAITASSDDVIKNVSDDHGLIYEFCHADEITLKTIIRSNPGLLLIKNGNIIGKWHFNDFPSFGLSGSDYRNIVDNYPFSPGSNIKTLSTPPPGSDEDIYETTLFYKNLTNDSISEFSISDFPTTPEWQFVNSESKIIRKGYKTPLDEFKPVTPEGLELSSDILSGIGNSFILITKDPNKIKKELLERFNNLSILAAVTDSASFRFFCVTALSDQELLRFLDSFITPVQFAGMSEKYIDKIAGDGLSMIWIRNGKVMGVEKDDKIPSPSDFSNYLSRPGYDIDAESMLLSPSLISYRIILEKRFVYLCIFGFFAFGLLIKIFNENIRSLK